MSSHINPSLQKVIVGLVVGAAVGATVQTAPSSSPSLQSFSPSHSVSSDMHRPLVHRNSPSPASAQVGAEEGVKLGWPVGAAVGTVVGAAVPGEAVGAPVGDLVERQILAASSEPSPQSDSSSQRRVASMHSPDEQRNSPSPAAEQVGDAVGVDVGTELLGPVVGTVVGAVDGREVEGAAVGPADGAAEHKLIASSLPSPQSCKCQDRLGDSGFNDAEPDSCNVIMAKSQEHRMHCGHGWSVDGQTHTRNLRFRRRIARRSRRIARYCTDAGSRLPLRRLGPRMAMLTATASPVITLVLPNTVPRARQSRRCSG